MKARRKTTLAERFAALLLSLFMLGGLLPAGALAEDAAPTEEPVYRVSYQWADDEAAPFPVEEATATAPKTTGASLAQLDLAEEWMENPEWAERLESGQYCFVGWQITDEAGETIYPGSDGNYAVNSDITATGIWICQGEDDDAADPDAGIEPLADPKYNTTFELDWGDETPDQASSVGSLDAITNEKENSAKERKIQNEIDLGGGVLL